MHDKDITRISKEIEKYLEISGRINKLKDNKYWYPLSMANYGIEEIIESLKSLITFQTSMSNKTIEFEKNFANYLNCNETIMVNSGSSADLLLAHLLVDPLNKQIDKDSEVLVPVVTWPTHIWSIMNAGLKPKLVDVDPKTLNIDLVDLKNKITKSTKALFIVHLMGNPCNMDEINNLVVKNNLILLEDACEALGSEWDNKKVGTFGLGGSFSFFFSHHMTTMEGGLVCCSSPEIADQLRILRAHGWLRNLKSNKYSINDKNVDSRYAFINWGFNLRPTELQAGFGIEQLKKLPNFNKKRKTLSDIFFKYIDDSKYFDRPHVENKSNPSWFALPCLIKSDAPFSKDDFVKYLEYNGVETRPIVTGNIAKHPVANVFSHIFEDTYKGADIIHNNGFYVGLSPLFNETQIIKLIDIFKKFESKY
tara:strand:- start:10923 stop:12188 length:1266 start_codon:yes stop_codon:yes gene_type:complete